MSREKQIEEMAKVLCNHCAGKESPCSVAKSGTMCRAIQREAEALYNSGYRKAPDVAREIFEELIDNATFIEYADGGRYLRFNAKFFAELKKKYTEEGK